MWGMANNGTRGLNIDREKYGKPFEMCHRNKVD